MKSLLLIASLLLSTSLFAQKVTFNVSLTPAGSFEAVSQKLKGNLIKKNSGFKADKLWISIESFKTGIELRDEHLWKHLNSSKHPKAVLTEVSGNNGKAIGKLTVNGVTKPVSMTYTENGKNVTAAFTVKASAFNLPKAQYMGVGVSDEVNLKVTSPFVVK
jgi:polyisoprenoid-binding protein YceI